MSRSGAIDTTFSPVGAAANGFTGSVFSLALSGASLFVGGNVMSYRGVLGSSNLFAKLDATTGAIDTAFLPAGNSAQGVTGLQVRTVLASGTTVWLGGSFDVYGGASVNRLAKMDDVTFKIDTTFSPPANNGFNSNVRALASSGTSIYVGGDFRAYKGVFGAANRIAKLDASGALDTTFSPMVANGFDFEVRALAANATDVYVGGEFQAYKGVANSAIHLAKLNAVTGAIDTAFGPVGVGANGFDARISALALNATDLYVGGSFTAYKGAANSANRIAKLNPTTGALDTTFSPPGATANGFNREVDALALNATDVYVGGDFTSHLGVANSANGIAKLNRTTGALDTTFSPLGATANGFDGSVQGIVLDATHVYLVGGFTAYRGVANSAIAVAKIAIGTGAIDTTFSPVGATANGFGRGEVNTIGIGTSTCSVGCGTVLLVGGRYTVYRGARTLSMNVLDVGTGAAK